MSFSVSTSLDQYAEMTISASVCVCVCLVFVDLWAGLPPPSTVQSLLFPVRVCL